MEISDVIRGLECVSGLDDNEYCGDCPYRKQDEECDIAVAKDALELVKAYKELQERHRFLVEKCDDMYSTLKERNKEIETLELQNAYLETEMLNEEPKIIRCKDCKYGEPWGVLIGCGTSKGFGITHNPDWFCGDGEVK